MTANVNAVEVDRGAPAARGAVAAGLRNQPMRRSPLAISLGVLVAGLVVTGVLAALSHSVYDHSQQRLLRLRARDVAAVVSAIIPGVQTPLASAAELADGTGGSITKFRTFAKAYAGPGRTFTSLSLWKLGDIDRGPVAVVGASPGLSPGPAAQRFFRQVLSTPKLVVIGLLKASPPRLGYGFSTPFVTGGYAAYGESELPPSRYSPAPKSSSFRGLGYALYLDRVTPAQLLATDERKLPLTGSTTTLRLPFGDNSIVLKMSATGSLSGSLPRVLPWIIGVVGTLISLTAAFGVMRLLERRRRAEDLAAQLELTANENERLYAEQRTIAQTLQHALLPQRLPELRGVEVDGRYVAAERAVDVGGDWYDVVELRERCALLVIGDVSGHGLSAATTMASLRFAIHAYAAQGDRPETILAKLASLSGIERSGHIATVLCAHVDFEERSVNVVSAGHLPALLIADDGSGYLEIPVGLPIGVDPEADYQPLVATVPPGGTLIAFTDGLVERRGENLDVGLERLRERVREHSGQALPSLLEDLLSDLVRAGSHDDVAIVGIRWPSQAADPTWTQT